MNRTFAIRLLAAITTCVALTAALHACGARKGDTSASAPSMNEFERAMAKQADAHGIPLRFMLAVAMYESNITSQPSRIPYVGQDRKSLGFTVAETAFGVSRATLGLTDADTGDDFMVQASAYAAWIGGQVKDLKLNANPQTAEEKYNWLWQLANLHRLGDEYTRENRVIWATGLMNLMNNGHVWQDASGKNRVVLAKENPPMDVMNFPNEGQKWMTLNLEQGELRNTKQLELITHPGNQVNTPTHIEVIHCPLNLSACIEIQNATDGQDDARLRTHYIIPQDDTIVSRPLQTSPHEFAVEHTNNDGSSRLIDDAIVIMLVGNSGRYDRNGVRVNANPTWFTPWQLKEMGKLAHRICQVITQSSEATSVSDCLNSRHENGIRFHFQHPQAESYKWGEIPDFDEIIFNQYVKDTNTDGEAVFEFPNAAKRVDAGDEFEFSVRFPVTSRRVVIERAVRCPNQKIVWATTQSIAVNAKSKKTFNYEIYDGGPNGDGHYFLRALAYDNDENLVGWAVDDLFVENFDTSTKAGDAKACLRNGT